MTGRILATLQFALCLALVAAGYGDWGQQPALWLPTAAGIAILSLGLWAMRQTTGTVKITPEPAAGTPLCERGIYRLIRHPMYAGLLLGFAPFGAASESPPWGWGLWLGLLAVLLGKMRIEETLLAEQIAEYQEYMHRTKRLLPFVW